MLGLVLLLLLTWLGTAAVSALVTGAFWLTLTALALVMLTAAVGLSLYLRRAERDNPETRTAIPVRHAATVRFAHHDDGRLRRAA